MVAIFSRGRNQWLSRSISGLLLVLFALSITPKKTLHDWLVHHQDDTGCHAVATPSIIKSGFHCDTDNTVAESPFTGEGPVILPEPPVDFISFNDAVNMSLHAYSVFYSPLRGPPVISWT